ncbi:uncharacterized protein [Argopecten irradians]|uniref:uncharacterized protein n=1 Tax=Argopecten irradians TaxID=31199 RepID=UPI00371D74DF
MVLRHIGKIAGLRRYGGKSREWLIICCDGLPYTMLFKLIQEYMVCSSCNKGLLGINLVSQHRKEHQDEVQFIREFDWVLGLIHTGYGQYELNGIHDFENWTFILIISCFLFISSQISDHEDYSELDALFNLFPDLTQNTNSDETNITNSEDTHNTECEDTQNTECENPSTDNESLSPIYDVQAKSSGEARKRDGGRFVRRTPSKNASREAQREKARVKAQLNRRRTALYKQLAMLEVNTGWKGFIVLKSGDGKKIAYGGTDTDMELSFLEEKPLCNNVKAKTAKNFKKVDMANVIKKVAVCSKQIVPESPGPSPSKVPSCMESMLPFQNLAKDQATTLAALPLDMSDKTNRHSVTCCLFYKRKPQVNLFSQNKKRTKTKKSKK